MAFIDKIIDYIEHREFNYGDLTIVLPSQRAKKHLEGAFFDRHKRAFFPPKILTMDAWVRENVPKIVIDKTRLLVMLFAVHQEITRAEKQQPFDEFIEWAGILLSDFDEIDRYLVEPNSLFRSLHALKELEYWRINAEEEYKISVIRQRFMEFWELLPTYYRKFHQHLAHSNACYMGHAYRYLAEHIDLVFRANKNSVFLFSGFNALSTAEEQIIKQLYTLGRGHILIDADVFYTHNKQHEAGMFIRNLFTLLENKNIPFIEDQLTSKSMTMRAIECGQLTGQIKVASSILLNSSAEEIEQTAIILADETLIVPLLKNIPQKVKAANVTLGMPLKSSAIKNWVDLLFSVQEGFLRFNSSAYYHNHLKQLFSHPFFIHYLSTEEQKDIEGIEKKIRERNWIFVSKEKLTSSLRVELLLELIGTNWHNDWQKALQTIRALNNLLFEGLNTEQTIEKALLYSFDKALIDFQNMINEGLPDMKLRTFKNLLALQWQSASIAFFGSPTKGLQIMGLLETRMLDFKHIICLGLNEGTLPPTNPIQSLIPMDLRRYAGLPTPREKQGIFAHHFYRLLHYCETMTITYSSAKESIGSNEKSRYLVQIEKELARQNKNISFDFQFYAVPMQDNQYVNWKKVEKTPEIFSKLDGLFQRSTSISTLNAYHRCSLDFYYRYILEFGEDDTVEEELESSSFGTIVHQTLEILYSPHAKYDKNGMLNPRGGQSITQQDIEAMSRQVDQIIEELFTKQFNGDKKAFEQGKNKLSLTIAKQMVHDFLHQEKKNILLQKKIIIHSVEKKIKIPVLLSIEEQEKTFMLSGTIDRIDEIDGKIRLIDYKTGNCRDEDVTLKEVSNRSKKSEMELNIEVKHLMQLLMYCYLYKQSMGIYPDSAGIISMLRLKNGMCELNLNQRTISEVTDQFPEWITELMSQIYDPDIPFEHTNRDEKRSYCTYCH